jgi:hypothetical protein
LVSARRARHADSESARITEVFLVVSMGEGAWPTEYGDIRGSYAPRHRGWVLSALHFREIMTLVPFDAAAGPEPSICTGSGL